MILISLCSTTKILNLRRPRHCPARASRKESPRKRSFWNQETLSCQQNGRTISITASIPKSFFKKIKSHSRRNIYMFLQYYHSKYLKLSLIMIMILIHCYQLTSNLTIKRTGSTAEEQILARQLVMRNYCIFSLKTCKTPVMFTYRCGTLTKMILSTGSDVRSTGRK